MSILTLRVSLLHKQGDPPMDADLLHRITVLSAATPLVRSVRTVAGFPPRPELGLHV